jgi:hypothetical protein
LNTPKEEDYYKDLVFVTLTEELFVPVRLYYDIYNMDMLRQTLSKLKCVTFCNGCDNFTVFSGDEVKNIGLSIPYNKVPKRLQPVKLMTGTILPSGTLYCDFESQPRAVGMMNFFDKRIPSTVMRLNAAAIANEMLVVKKSWLETNGLVRYEKIFNDDIIMYHNYDPINEHIENMGLKDSEYRAEKFYVKYDEHGFKKDALDFLTIRLGLKERMIFQRSVVGNSDCKAMDILNEIAEEYHKNSNKKVKQKIPN